VGAQVGQAPGPGQVQAPTVNSQQPAAATTDGSSLEVVYLSVKFKCNTA